jgi:hypothetical protein
MASQWEEAGSSWGWAGEAGEGATVEEEAGRTWAGSARLAREEAGRTVSCSQEGMSGAAHSADVVAMAAAAAVMLCLSHRAAGDSSAAGSTW